MSTDTPANPAAKPAPHHPPQETLKDTLISIMIAFTMAFVFRGFVIEAFVIPTGSMAPTLMGAHMPLRGERTGYTWPVGAYLTVPGDSASYQSIQPPMVTFENKVTKSIDLQDPVGGDNIPAQSRRCYSGDRILVLKYLYGLKDPARFDVIVFKDPQNTTNNFIKRLIGLPGEQIALADGDVFLRTEADGLAPAGDGPAARAALWEQKGWRVARKDPVVQRTVWQLVHDTAFAPLDTTDKTTPWLARDAQWSISAREFRYAGSGTTGLMFDQSRPRSSSEVRGGRRLRWAIDDYYPYNDVITDMMERFPVSDVRIRCGFRPEAQGQTIAMVLEARGHEFRATVGAGAAKIEVRRPVGAAGMRGTWETVETKTVDGLPAGVFSSVEFWHVDQSVQIWLDGRKVASHEYDWSPGERIGFATGKPLVEIMRDQAADPQGRNRLANKELFFPCTVGFEFTGGAFTLTRIGVDRDLHYVAASKSGGSGISALGTSPYAPLTLGPDQFFACGDNSPQSHDGRLWADIDPWVHELYPAPPGPYPVAGVIPRELLLGKAFFVYWPSLKYSGNPVPVPDFGRMRFIW